MSKNKAFWKDRARRAERSVEALEALRPVWAQGYTADSIAAQTTAAALAGVWSLLGVDNQTDAMTVLRKLTVTEASPA